ncbi:MAG: WecB/TagA/CpsF family glycosyltransferase, partial [Patescibacteria group bacterium]
TKDEIKSAIYKKFPKLSFELRYSGEGKVEQMIDQFRPDLVFVALGAPDQEKWIAHHIRKFGYVKMYAGIGGGFDFLAETQKRAPAWVRKTGFEWLWRLIRHPNRIGRIFNAVVVFPVKVLFSSSRER